MPNVYKLKRVRDGEEYPLMRVSSLVGRSASCDISVEAGHASREHARLIEKKEGVVVEDLHSTNGTYINDHEIEEATLLKVGDVVRFDEEAFCLQRIEDGDATVVMRPVSASANNVVASAMDDDDEEEDEDSTRVIEVYPMPPGWSIDDTMGSGGASDSEKKKSEAIERYLQTTTLVKEKQGGLALIFLVDQESPVIKTLSRKSNVLSWRFGRGEDQDLRFNSPCISKHHGVFKYLGGKWVYEDNESANGIWLGNERLRNVTLADGMKLQIGTVELRVRIVE